MKFAIIQRRSELGGRSKQLMTNGPDDAGQYVETQLSLSGSTDFVI